MRLLQTLIMLLVITTSLSAQFDEWVFVRILPPAYVEEFEILSENELIVLEDGLLYYSDNQGEDWRLLFEADEAINSLTIGDDGYFYYKSDLGLFKQKIGEEPTRLIEGYASYTLGLTKEDTIVMYNSAGYYYSYNDGQNWNHSNHVSIYSSSNLFRQDIQLKQGLLHHITTSNEISTYNLSTDEKSSINVDDNSIFLFGSLAWYYANPNGPTILDYFNNAAQPEEGNIKYYLSTDNATTSSHIPIGIPIQQDTYISKIHEGLNDELIRISFKPDLNEFAQIHISTDQGYNWSTIQTDSLAIEAYPELRISPNCSYAYIISRNRLYRSKNKITSTESIEENFSSKIKLTPNPSEGIFNIETSLDFNPITISIYNLNGQLIQNNQHSLTTQSIDISHQPDGIYLLKMVDRKGVTRTQQIIKI